MIGEPLVFFDNVTVSYPGMDRPAVHQLSLALRAGERVALIGPSGAGKSTILSLAAGLTLPSAGTVRVFGVETADLGRRAHRPTRRRIGIISQDYALVGPLRVATNVAAGRLGSKSWTQVVKTLVRPGPIEEIQAALDAVGIADKLWDRSDQLSGGEQQRTAVARTLFQGGDLVLADEPVSALDPARSESVIDLLCDGSASGQMLLASMHDASLALRHFDRVVAIAEGQVRFDQPAVEVTGDQLRELYELAGESPAS